MPRAVLKGSVKIQEENDEESRCPQFKKYGIDIEGPEIPGGKIGYTGYIKISRAERCDLIVVVRFLGPVSASKKDILKTANQGADLFAQNIFTGSTVPELPGTNIAYFESFDQLKSWCEKVR